MFNRHFSPWKTLVDRDRRVAMLLNPKVLSTFARKFLTDGYKEFHGRQDASEGRYRLLNNARRMPTAPLRDYWHFLRHHEEYAIYALVRNPYARTLSGWRNKFHDGHFATEDGTRKGYPREMRGRELTALRQFAHQHGLAGAGEGTLVPFDTFVRAIHAGKEGKLNQHWEPQTKVLQCHMLTYRRVIRIEDQLEDGIRDIGSALGFDPDWSAARLKVRENISSSATERAYTQDIADLVYDLAQSDFDGFGYDRGSWRGL